MKTIEERLSLIESRMGISAEPFSVTSPTQRALSKLGIVLLLYTASNRLRDNPSFSEYDEFLKSVFKGEPSVESRRKCADEMFQLSLSLIDEASEDYKKHETKAEPTIPEPKFDFEKNAFERLKKRIGDAKIGLREYYRLMGAYYSLRKSESRDLLKSLKLRFPIKTDNVHVWISTDYKTLNER